jgi:hypothetical protein
MKTKLEVEWARFGVLRMANMKIAVFLVVASAV